MLDVLLYVMTNVTTGIVLVQIWPTSCGYSVPVPPVNIWPISNGRSYSIKCALQEQKEAFPNPD